MFRLIARIASSRFLKLLFRIVASLASAILVVSGYLFFLSVSDKGKEEKTESEEIETDPDEEID